MVAGSARGKRAKRQSSKPPEPKKTAAKSLMDAAVDETAEDIGGGPDADHGPELDDVEYVTVRIPVKHIRGMPTVKAQRANWTPRQARAQRLIYDGMHFSGVEPAGSFKQIGTTAPLWHATAWLLDQVADAFGMDPSSLDALA